MTELIPIISGRCLVVELPPDAELISPVNGHDRTWSYWSETEKYGTFEAPPGKWHIIGRLSEVTEEQASNIVQSFKFKGGYLYNNYITGNRDTTDTALESLESAILAAGWYFDNPYKNEPVLKKLPSEIDEHIERFAKAQSRVLDRSRCLLLGREI